MRKSLKYKQNALAFTLFKNIIDVLKKCEDEGEIDLYFFDEAIFNLVPCVPYGWIQINEDLLLPSSKSKNLSVLGFINRKNDLHSYIFEGNVNSDVVIECFNDFSKKIKTTSVVIMDNASIHTSKKFESQRMKWKCNGLIICNLPTYSPELNKSLRAESS